MMLRMLTGTLRGWSKVFSFRICLSEYIWLSSRLPVPLCSRSDETENDFVWSKEIPVRWSVPIQNSPLKGLSPRVSYCSPPLMYFLESLLTPYQQSSWGCRYSIALCAMCHVLLQVSTLIAYSVTAEWIVVSFCHVWVLCEIPFISEWSLTAFYPRLRRTDEVMENTCSPTFKPNFKHVGKVIVCRSFIILYWFGRRQQLDDAVICKRGTQVLAEQSY